MLIGSTVLGSIGLHIQFYIDFYNKIPLTGYKLSWVPAAILFMVIGYFSYEKKLEKKLEPIKE